MGLSDNSRSYKQYLNIYGGQIVREWRKSKPSEDQIPIGKELQTREITAGKNKGNTIWFIGYDHLSGIITKVVLDESGDYGDKIIITINSVDEDFELNLPVNSSFGSDFLFKMQNIQLGQEITFSPWSMSKEEWLEFTGKQSKNGKSGLTLTQNNEKLDKFYSKENPKDLPALIEKRDRKGNLDGYDDTDQMNFLLNKLEEFINSIPQGTSAVTNSVEEPNQDQGTSGSSNDDDDLPF